MWRCSQNDSEWTSSIPLTWTRWHFDIVMLRQVNAASAVASVAVGISSFPILIINEISKYGCGQRQSKILVYSEKIALNIASSRKAPELTTLTTEMEEKADSWSWYEWLRHCSVHLLGYDSHESTVLRRPDFVTQIRHASKCCRNDNL